LSAVFCKAAALTAPLQANTHRPFGKLLLAGLLSYGVTTGALIAGALAASVLPAQTPLTQSGLTMQTGQSGQHNAQPMPPLPDQPYDARFNEGAVTLEDSTAFAGIDPFITGPVPKK